LCTAIAQHADSTVVERDSVVVGFANFYQWEHGGRCAIGNIMVDAATRGGGVGRYLVTHMIERAFNRPRHRGHSLLLQRQYRQPAALSQARLPTLCR